MPKIREQDLEQELETPTIEKFRTKEKSDKSSRNDKRNKPKRGKRDKRMYFAFERYMYTSNC